MPLRLARYGVPLAETAPSGLAAAGIEEPPIVFTVERAPASVRPDSSTPDVTAENEPAPAERDNAEPQPVQAPVSTVMPEQPTGPQESTEETAERFAEAYRAFIAEFQIEPTPTQWALWLRDTYGISTGSGDPLSEDQVQPLLQVLQERYTARSEEPVASEEPQSTDQSADQWDDYFYSAWRTYEQERGTYPGAAALAAYVYERDGITGADGRPVTGEDVADFVATFREREFGSTGPPAEEAAADPGEQAADEVLAQEEDAAEAPAGAGAQAANEKRTPRVSAAIDDSPPGADGAVGERAVLTTVDHYYLAWMEYQTEHGEEPTAEQLSTYLAQKGKHGRGDKPVSPANLRRYFLPSRVYNVWAEHRMRNEQPAADAVAQDCAARGITAQYNKPVTTDYITEKSAEFERRRQALIRHHADAQQ
jgi:hypothetical protein